MSEGGALHIYPLFLMRALCVVYVLSISLALYFGGKEAQQGKQEVRKLDSLGRYQHRHSLYSQRPKRSTAVTHRLGRNFRNFGHLLLCSIYGAKNDFQENMT